VIGASETGSGKTLAYAVPIVHELLERRARLGQTCHVSGPMLALVMTPTRELAMQVVEHIKAFAHAATDVKIAAVVGGMSAAKQERLLSQGPEIVVATTGRFWELISRHGNPFLADLSALMFFVLDEADRMIEAGHFRELDGITALVKQAKQAQQ
jgi:ATP-dependent RNA helicase DDX24/MAK5